ncbi:MAG TPA: DUF4446 family protein [Armatimonadetes bacterium]|nr:DUF4446 family protein [Armatimonadota bacterium]
MNQTLILIGTLLETYRTSIILGLTGAVLLLTLWNLGLSLRLRRLQQHYYELAAGVESGNLEQLLHRHLERIQRAEATVAKLTQQVQALQEQGQRCLQHVGLVRYNAFEDIGGELSFAVALLDAQANGVVLNGILGRETTRIYAKPISQGRSPISLSEEEQRAILLARGSAAP